MVKIFIKMTMSDWDIMLENGKVFSHRARGAFAIVVYGKDGGRPDNANQVYFTDVDSLNSYKLSKPRMPSKHWVEYSYNDDYDADGHLKGFVDYNDFEDQFWAMKDRGDMDEDDALHAQGKPNGGFQPSRPATPAPPEADEEWPGDADIDTEP